MRKLAILTAAGLCLSAPAFAQSSADQKGLVTVNLQNVLNDLSAKLKVDRANIPVTAQIPINAAANVCGVSVNVLSSQASSGTANCNAKTGSQELTQAVQQQMAAGGTAGGQSGTTAAVGSAPPAAGAQNTQSTAATSATSSSAQVPAGSTQPGTATTRQAQTAQAPAASTQAQGSNAAPAQQAAAPASAQAQVSEAQQAQVATTIGQANMKPADVTFSITQGMTLPATVALYPMPAAVVKLVPQYRGYSYFRTKDRIVVVEPRKKTVVAVIPASGARAQAPAASKTKMTLTDEQRASIRKQFSASKKAATTGSSSRASRITVQQEVPATVQLQEFSEEVVREVPAVRSYRYYQQDDDVVVVDPGERRVIEIIR